MTDNNTVPNLVKQLRVTQQGIRNSVLIVSEPDFPKYLKDQADDLLWESEQLVEELLKATGEKV